jgi:uncharacterized protein
MYIKLRVHPGAKKNELNRKAPDLFEVWVKAPASDGRANRACLSLVAAALGLPAGRLRLIKGGRSPSKIIEIPG